MVPMWSPLLNIRRHICCFVTLSYSDSIKLHAIKFLLQLRHIYYRHFQFAVFRNPSTNRYSQTRSFVLLAKRCVLVYMTMLSDELLRCKYETQTEPPRGVKQNPAQGFKHPVYYAEFTYCDSLYLYLADPTQTVLSKIPSKKALFNFLGNFTNFYIIKNFIRTVKNIQ